MKSRLIYKNKTDIFQVISSAQILNYTEAQWDNEWFQRCYNSFSADFHELCLEIQYYIKCGSFCYLFKYYHFNLVLQLVILVSQSCPLRTGKVLLAYLHSGLLLYNHLSRLRCAQLLKTICTIIMLFPILLYSEPKIIAKEPSSSIEFFYKCKIN